MNEDGKQIGHRSEMDERERQTDRQTDRDRE